MRALIAAALLWTGAASAQGPGGTPALEIHAKPVEIGPGSLKGLRLRGSVSLTAAHDEFGGLSGLLVDAGRMIAVTDRGWWLLADLTETSDGLVPRNAGFTPMTGPDGSGFDKAGGDAEGLAIREGTLAVSFERDHRIMFHQGEGQLGETVSDRAFERLGSNNGLEALATTPDGWLLAIAEAPRGGNHPVFVRRWSGEIIEGSLPEVAPFYVTGADVGPDGRLYVVLRDYNPLFGVSIRIHRFELDGDGFPRPDTRQQLAAFDSASGIDNMEGIALWTDAEDRTRLALISDDNFNFIQRTLLMDFELLD